MIEQEHLSLFRNVPMFSGLPPAKLSALTRTARILLVEAGEQILAEGDLGNEMYLIESGAIQVYTKGFVDEDIVLARLEAGQWFGEQALLTGEKGSRNANVRAIRRSTLVVISRDALFAALGEDTALIKELQKVGDEQRQQRRLKLQESMLGPRIQVAQEAYEFRSYAAGEVVFREGDPGDRVYLILSGSARLTRREGAEDRDIAELMPGQFFGERAILKEEPRWATVAAITYLEAASIDGAWFRRLHDENATLRSLTKSLSSIYMLPSIGMLVLQTGHIGDEAVVTTTHHLADGRQILSTRIVGRALFVSRFLTVEVSARIRWESAERSAYRLLGITDGKITSIYAEGEWAGLGEVLSRMLNGQALLDWEIRLFEHKGELSTQEQSPIYEPREILCACTRTTCGQIQDAIRQGCRDIQALAAQTGVTLVCGGCAPLVQDLLGRPDFIPANVVSILSLGREVRAVRIRPADGACVPYAPGQYIIIQTRIDGHWVQRSYTLSAPFSPDEDYEIIVKREPQGVFSRWLFNRAERGHTLRISKPLGQFCLPEDNTSAVVCLTGGIGVTPALSMARALAAESRPLRFHLEYSVTNHEDAICREELESFTQRNPAMSVHVRCTRTDGRVARSDVYRFLSESPDAVFYLCGSERFLDGITDTLKACGVSAERIRTEAFTVAGEKPPDSAIAKPAVCPVDHVSVQDQPKTPLDEAAALLRDYYAEVGSETVLKSRLRQVEEEFRDSGTYRQTVGELTFAARSAWRNSVRCIGRLYWQGLTVRDFRHVTTGGEMLDAIFEHIELATNGGNIRPMMTVFPPEVPGQQSFRVWSPQFFRYAGYKRQDGSVLGDLGNMRFTEVATSLGWLAPENRSSFDLLPVIVQAPGQKPEWRSIPKHLVMEASIEHPDLPWFADLGLKWYALPAVSNMLFDGGGVRYLAAPFNGWYMGTEIGARNFSDTYRYNLLPEVARRMGLDTSCESSLWRDRALVELNVALLYSFEKAGITMLDHHSAAQSFDRFEDIEKRAGRPVYARWSWLVPPISGSAVSLFHRDWPDVELKPNYFAQPAPWARATDS